ncbi:unnamed protein product [Candidula unifasciata]|uniref:MYND-type domain-containing protein n=1 Tax=Candidula unifasciata TaxID=100452 RepID=A0A8S3YU16_9EUPU|nr:unnamed protein product [Candidula unifasciata]
MATKTEDKRTPDEKKLFELMEKGKDLGSVSHESTVSLQLKGMTPLQYAAFRGNRELCEFFLANGADVNSNYHENSYSALMFAALSGNTEVTRLMLEAGANIYHVNSVNRTATQMAAFVGQHQCVSVINNFFPREEIEYYTKPQGLETEAKLPAAVAPSLCTLINFTNLHPVKISLFLRDHPQILNEHKKVVIVLSRLVEKNMKSRETNDVLAMKCHFISCIIKLAAEAKEKDKEHSLNTWLKALMKGREEDGFLEFQERLIRQALKEFPYASSALFQQLVRQIAPVKIGNEPTALSLLIAAMNGQQFAWEAAEGCDTCGEPKAKSKCSKCKMVAYCNQECQRLHWPTHKKFCDKLAERYRKEEERRKKEEEKQREEEEKRRQEEEQRKKEEENQNEEEGKEPEVLSGQGDADTKANNDKTEDGKTEGAASGDTEKESKDGTKKTLDDDSVDKSHGGVNES